MRKLFMLTGAALLGRAAWKRRHRIEGQVTDVLERHGIGRHAVPVGSPDGNGASARNGGQHVSQRDGAVDHDRSAGVPPPASDDYEGLDSVSAQSFPASDPPSNW